MYSTYLFSIAALSVSMAACTSNLDDRGTDGSHGSGGSRGTGQVGSDGKQSATGGSNGASSTASGFAGSGATEGAGSGGKSSPAGGASAVGMPGKGGAMSSGGAMNAGSSGRGDSTSGGAAGGGMSGSGGTAAVSAGKSGLPVPSGAANVAKPTGMGTKVTVINWAGFKGAVTYSFDDDNDSQIQNYDQLQAAGGQYTFFLWTGKSQAMNSVWKKALMDGHEIGNHTMSHDSNGACTSADIEAATTFIQTNLNIKPWTMAAPNGATCYVPFAQQLFFINRGAGHDASHAGVPILPNDSGDPSNTNVYVPATGQSASTFQSEVDDGRAKGGWVVYVVHGFTGDGSAFQPVDLGEMITAIKYAKSLPDVWVGRMMDIGAYWVGQKTFTQAMTSSSGNDKTYAWTLPKNFPTSKYLRVTTDGGALKQNGAVLAWDPHGYYEIALDAGSVTLSSQ
jgi:hypothetical protein